MKEAFSISCPAFETDGSIPKKHTGFGEDTSPAFELKNLSDQAVSVAIIMDDIDVPICRELNHWVIWNLPAQGNIPEGIPKKPAADGPANAVQGVGWGKNRYRGPKQPPFIRKAHRYRFTCYVLDRFLDLDKSCRKAALLAAMEGHVIQQGEVIGTYKR